MHKGVDFSKHSSAIAYFQKEFIKNGIFDKQFSKIITNAFSIRSNTDYTDFYVISKQEAEEQLDNAKSFVEKIEQY